MDLSKRLQAVADMVEPGSVVADVGCDHGYVSMYLVRQGICPRVLAMDVNRGPLERAREHVEEAGLSDYIELRLSDGLKAMELPEADTLLTAGLGGRLAARILEDSAEKVLRMKWLILQPQSEIWLVRQTLRKMGYSITAENMILEEGKYYTVIKARNERWADGGWQEKPVMSMECEPEQRVPCAEFAAQTECQTIAACPADLDMDEKQWLEAADRFGMHLILGRHPVLRGYLTDTLQKNRMIASKIREEMQAQSTSQRLELLEQENGMLEKLAAWME